MHARSASRTMRLSATRAAQTRQSRAHWIEERTIPHEPYRAPLRVLLADDDSISLELLSLLLTVNGETVIPASGGQEALDALAQSSLPDAVLVDHQMPGIGGADVARHVKSLPIPRPRVIAMSASPLSTDELALFDGFLLKPVTSDLLANVLHRTSQADGPQATETPAGLRSLDAANVQRLQAIMSPDALQELYTVFVSDARKRINECERSCAEGDEAGVRRCGHALKGAAAMVGAPGIASIAAGLEAGRFPKEEHGRLFGELRTACDDVEQSITTMMSSALSRETR
jgi:CheY-like chemotaxis protein